jgi:hypothetical protein
MAPATCTLMSSFDRTKARVDDFAAKYRAVAEEPVLLKQRSKTSRSSHSERGPDRWRAGLLVVFVIPAVLFASGVKLARASSYETHPILCGGVDYNTAEPVLCVLPDEATKKSSLMKVRPLAGGTIFSPASLRPHVAEVRGQLISFSHSPRFNRLLTRPVSSSGDPDGAH